MSNQYDDDDQSDEQSKDYESGSFKLSKPPSIDRYFGKINGHIKLLQASAKLNLSQNKNPKLEIKYTKDSKYSRVMPGTRIYMTSKDNNNKFSLSFKPYCMVPARFGGLNGLLYPFQGGQADLEFGYSTLIKKVSLNIKLKDRGQSNIKFKRTFNIIQNALKVYLQQSFDITKKGEYKTKNCCQILTKTPLRKYNINQNDYIETCEKLSYKTGHNTQAQLKFENSFQLFINEPKQKQRAGSQSSQKQSYYQPKIKPYINFYHTHRLTHSSKESDIKDLNIFNQLQIKSMICLFQNFTKSNVKLDLQYTSSKLQSWQLRYFIQKGKWRGGLSYGLKSWGSNRGQKNDDDSIQENVRNVDSGEKKVKWQLLLEKDQLLESKYLNGGIYLNSEGSGCRLWGKPSRNHKFELICNMKKPKDGQKTNNRKKNEGKVNIGIKYNYNA